MSEPRPSPTFARALLLAGLVLLAACAAPAPADAGAGTSGSLGTGASPPASVTNGTIGPDETGGPDGATGRDGTNGTDGHGATNGSLLAVLAPDEFPENVDPVDPVALAPAPAVLQRVAVIGASGSNGFGIRAEIGTAIRLADLVGVAIRGVHEPPLDASNAFFFLDPEAYADELVSRALAYRPTLLVAADFLFWFGYGVMPEEARPRRLEHGLALLDRFDCPLLVGDLPYMPQAVGGMLLASQLPEEATVEALNARIRAWCDERPRATVVPVGDFAERLTNGLEVDLEGTVLGGAGGADVLQPDRLHPTLLGAAGLTVLALERLVHAGLNVPRGALELDPALLAERALAARAERD